MQANITSSGEPAPWIDLKPAHWTPLPAIKKILLGFALAGFTLAVPVQARNLTDGEVRISKSVLPPDAIDYGKVHIHHVPFLGPMAITVNGSIYYGKEYKKDMVCDSHMPIGPKAIECHNSEDGFIHEMVHVMEEQQRRGVIKSALARLIKNKGHYYRGYEVNPFTVTDLNQLDVEQRPDFIENYYKLLNNRLDYKKINGRYVIIDGHVGPDMQPQVDPATRPQYELILKAAGWAIDNH